MLDAKTKLLLDDRTLYPQRAKMVQKEYPREDFPDHYRENGELVQSNPAQALKTLHTYLNNCLNGNNKPIPLRNKRLLHNMGNDADGIFYKAHYKLDDTDDPVRSTPLLIILRN